MRASLKATILLLGICVPLISSGQMKISIPDGIYSVSDLLPIISSQCKLTESFASDLLSQANPVIISGCKNKTLEQVLEMVCKDQLFTYIIDEATFTFVRSIDVRGSVVPLRLSISHMVQVSFFPQKEIKVTHCRSLQLPR